LREAAALNGHDQQPGGFRRAVAFLHYPEACGTFVLPVEISLLMRLKVHCA